MKNIKRSILCIFVTICFLFVSAVPALAESDVNYLAKISYLSAVYDVYTEQVEYHFETTGTLYSNHRFSVSVTCTAYEDGAWCPNTLLVTSFYGFDSCVISGNVVEGSVSLSKSVYQNPLYKDFVVTVDGEAVDMGEFIVGDYYDLDSKTVPLTRKEEPSGAFFKLASNAECTAIPLGGLFTYKVYPTDIIKTISGGLSRFSFTLNYNPSVLQYEGLSCVFPRGTGWQFKECAFVSNGLRVSLEGQGIKDNGDVSLVFRFRTLQAVSDTELYALDVGGGDSYNHSYSTTEELLLAPTPVIRIAALGDVNADGYIDSMDASAILKYDAGITYDAFGGDVNKDGYIDSMDAAMILKYDAGIIDSIGG